MKYLKLNYIYKHIHTYTHRHTHSEDCPKPNNKVKQFAIYVTNKEPHFLKTKDLKETERKGQ